MNCPICCEDVPLITCPACNAPHCADCFHDTMATMLAYPMCLACPHRYDRPFLVANGIYDAAYFRKLYCSLEHHKVARALQAVTYMENKERMSQKHDILSKVATLLIPLAEMAPEVDTFSGWVREELDSAIVNHTFIGYCYNRKTCRGLVTDTHRCIACKTQFCPVCHQPNAPGHVCDATLKLISSDTKQCPKCGTLSFKLNGCDQLWCPIPTCHTFWSWESGEPQYGVKGHNPMYLEWLAKEKRLKRDIMDIPSGVEITREIVQEKLMHRVPRPFAPGLMYVLDLTERAIPELNAKITMFDADLALQSEFIFEQMTEADFEAGAYTKHAQKEYDIEILDILVTLRDIGSAIFGELAQYGRFSALLLLLEQERRTLNRVFDPPEPYPSLLFSKE